MMREGTYECVVHSSSAMDRLADTLAPLLRSGDVMMLNGDLGAGKTRFVQGLAHALGVDDDVTSPTFTVQLVYDARDFPLYHFDLYRLGTADDLEDVGYWEALEGDGVTFIEWGDKFPDDTPEDYLETIITVEDDLTRRMRVKAHGERSEELLSLWADAAADLQPIS